MASSIPLQLAETVQTAHIRQNPSAATDLAPSTAADSHDLVVLEDLDEDDEAGAGEKDGDDDLLPYSYRAIKPWHPDEHGHHGLHGHRGRRFVAQLPAMPDLRFEQSYLRSVAAADRWWKVALITVRDQVLMPFTQGLLYNLGVCGWQAWNRNARYSGSSAGARLRRWWYGVNNWPLPAKARW